MRARFAVGGCLRNPGLASLATLLVFGCAQPSPGNSSAAGGSPATRGDSGGASRVVEPLVAATIVAVALENLARPEEPPGIWVARLATALSFGLIHGLGFAGALQQTGMGAGGTSLAVPLIAFNLVVELGQLLVALLIMLGLAALRRTSAFTRRLPQVTSLAIASIGLFWLVRRISG